MTWRPWIVAALIAACASNGLPRFTDQPMVGVSVPVERGAFQGLAWVASDLLAVTLPAGQTADRLRFWTLDGGDAGSLALKQRSICITQDIAGLSALPTGEVGFAEVCERDGEPARSSEFVAYDVQSETTRSLGSTNQRVTRLSWKSDMSSMIYTAEGSLCATLYEWDGDDRPLAVNVSIQGKDVPLGEDLALSGDRCTHHGLADYAAYGPDGQLALMAAPVGDVPGQDRVDAEWSLVVVSSDGLPRAVLGGVRHPQDLAWFGPDRLLVAGEIAGIEGLWTLRTDGSMLARISEIQPIAIAADSSTLRVIAILPHWELDTLASRHELVWFDLSSFR